MLIQENLILVSATANEEGKRIKTALLQLYKVAVVTTGGHTKEVFCGSGFSMATSQESSKQPAFILTIPVTKLSLSFLHEIKKVNKMKMNRAAFCMVFFCLTSWGE